MMTSPLTSTTPSSSCGLKIVLALLLSGLCLPVFAQRRVSADVEIKQAFDGKVLTTTKSVYCENNGRLVIVFHKPEEYNIITNNLGESRIYFPETNQTFSDNGNLFSSRDELISLFLSGRAGDLGLSLYGYKLSSTTMEGTLLKKTFVTTQKDRIPKVEIVYENYLPIYAGYLDGEGRTVSKTYFSHYSRFARLTMPCRTTSINYMAKGDSTVIRTVYSNVEVDTDNPWFDYEIPGDARTVKKEDILGQISGQKR